MVTQLFQSLELIRFLGVLVKKQTQLNIFQNQSYSYIKLPLGPLKIFFFWQGDVSFVSTEFSPHSYLAIYLSHLAWLLNMFYY